VCFVFRSGYPPAYGNADSCRVARSKEKTKIIEEGRNKKGMNGNKTKERINDERKD
jgi:hypothetical protein